MWGGLQPAAGFSPPVYWLEQTTGDLPPEDRSWLSPAEALVSGGFRFAKRRADWLLGRWTAKNALARCLAEPALARIELRPAPDGAPLAFIGGRPAPVSVSLTHRGGAAACAVAPARTALGCDLELAEPRSGAFLADYFLREEQRLVERAPPAGRFRLIALLWSAKESVLKALRSGLRADTRSVRIELAAPRSGPWQSLRARAGGQLFSGWWQSGGDLLRTIIAAPAAAPPIFITSEVLMPTLELEEEVELVEAPEPVLLEPPPGSEPWKQGSNPEHTADADWLFDVLMV